MTDSLATFLAAAPEATLVVAGPDSVHLVPPGSTPVVLPDCPDARPEPWDLAVIVVRDRLDLRAVAASLPSTPGRSRRVAVWLSGGSALLPRPGGALPPLSGTRARRLSDGSWLTVLRFTAPTSVGRVLKELARQAVRRDNTGDDGLWADVVASGAEVDVPAGVVLGDGDGATHPVLARAPVVLRDPDPVPCLDERVLNPRGFRAGQAGAVTALPVDATLTEGLAAALRDAAAVRVTWPSDVPDQLVRTVAGLAMAGVVLTSPEVPQRAAAVLGDDVVAGLTAPLVPDDLLAREEHSLVLRRAALDRFSSRSWRRRTATRAGVPIAADPAVSVVLATKRAEMLDFALAQVARQRGVALELVLAPHGFDVDPAAAQELLGDRVSLVLRPQASDVAFGDVLHAAAEATSGDLVLKMDDDDWYSPDAVADLVRARHYSGAEAVGMPAEFHYLTGPDLTVMRGHATEVYARFVAGGTLMVERALLREVGGFRSVRKYVDAQLLAAIAAAGGTLYRTHGLGYILRRNPSGHTWEVDLAYLLDPVRTKRRWDGFRPSRLMELDAPR